ncbi:MAG TPA: hypothetical protein VNH41_04290 [Steroidobacteraceae bacterium]|nr:hypothetical protein [Steroidobacteraceae bacterium]
MTSTVSDNVYLAFVERYRDDWVGLVREVLGAEPDEFQAAILTAVQNGEPRVAVRSGHGVGKSALGAWIAVCGLTTEAFCKVVMTAPSGPQLWDALFAETKLWFNQLPEALRELYRLGVDRIESIAAPEQLFVSARTSRAESPEAMQGVHAEAGRVILIGDEASGIPEAVFEAGAGSMSGKNCTTVLFSNPTRTSGFFYECFHRLKDRWFTRHVSCLTSKRVTSDYVEDMKARYGEDSNAYRVRVMGEFPIRDDATFIPLELVTAAQARDIAIDPKANKYWGVDVARFGNDLSVLVKRWGTVVPEAPKHWRRFDTMQLVGAIKFEYDNTPVPDRPLEILVDVIGIGAGVVDRCRELNLPVRGINVGESPAFDPTGSYMQLRDELWGKGKAWLEARNCKLPPDECFYELAVPRYAFQSNGKLKIESKPDMKKRGIGSPNYADGFLLTLAAEAGLSAGVGYSSNWSKPLRRNIKGVV